MILALSLLPILVLLLLAAGRSQLLRLQDAAAELQRHFDLVMTAEEVYKSIGHQAVSLRNIALYTDPEMIARETERLYARREDAERMLYRLEAEELTAEERYWVAQSVDVFRRIADYQDEVLLLLAAGRTEEAIERMNGTGAELRDRFEQTVGEMANHWEKEMADRLLGAPADFRRAVAEGALASLVVVLSLILFLGRNIWSVAVRLKTVSDVMAEVAGGTAGLDTRLPVRRNDEIDRVAKTFNAMAASLQEQVDKVRSEHWLKSSVADLTASLAGAAQPETIARRFLSKAAPATEACFGVFYLAETPEGEAEPVLRPLAAYACPDRSRAEREYRFGEGLAGQAALERAPIELQAVPSEYLGIRSGEGGERTLAVIALPVLYSEQVKAVVELASFTPFTERRREYLAEAVGLLGVLLENAESRQRLARLLRQSQAMTEALQLQSEELQSQQEELRRMNEELEEQAQSLKISEEKLKAQQEELEQANAELAERTKMLERQNRELERANRELNAARLELEEKAALLAQTSQYKSEFLANMSHELRTPLNSLLVLAKLLADNAEGNLTPRQVEFAKTIHEAGTALLQLINDILDLSKVEAGRMDIHPQQISLPRLVEYMEATFAPLAEDKELAFTVRLDPSAPQEIYTDEQRLQQVLRNLLSNAIKFTHEGEVRLEVGRAPADVQYADEALKNTPDMLAFRVIDTGIGIAPNKLDVIFEAFRQADGTTSRKYGGTGLGLSICRQIARLLGGEIHVASTPGEGSTFTLYLPAVYTGPLSSWDSGAAPAGTAAGSGPEPEQRAESVPPEAAPSSALTGLDSPRPSDADRWQGEDPLNGAKILIIDDDIRNVFALTSVLERHGATVVYAENGREGIEQLERNEDVALVLMDIMMPEMDGWATTSAIRKMPQFADLPIIALTAKVMHGDREKSIASGASDYVPKPVDVDLLLDRLRGWLAQSRSERGPAGRPEPREGGAPDA